MSKVKLVGLIRKRKMHLQLLMMQDIDKFNWIQRELRIKFDEDSDKQVKLSKADTRREAARKAASAAVEAKTEALRKALEEERVKFEKYKVRNGSMSTR